MKALKPSTSIQFDLLSNAADSLHYAIELLAWRDIASDQRRMKQAIMAVAHGVELLLKERLRRVQPSLIWEDVDRYPNLDARTVGAEKALARLRSIGGLEISADDLVLVKSLRRTRNAIEHFEWHTSIQEAKAVVGPALSFALDFASRELQRDLAYEFRRDDTWDRLVQELTEFGHAHASRLTAMAAVNDGALICCDHCGKWAIPDEESSCLLCGHWNAGSSYIPE